MKSFAAIVSLLGIASALPVTERSDPLEKRASTWWYASQDHSLSNDPYGYDVVQSVNAGDAQGLRDSIANGGRPAFNSEGATYLANAPRVVYLPPGTYELDSTLYLYTDTVILGDPTAPPTIKAASGFSGDSLIVGGAAGDYPSGHGELHFSVQLKNVILDTTTNTASNFNALHWRVAQNCALVNVQITLPSGMHTGIYLGQGSTISTSDVTIENGAIGFYYNGHQQDQLKGITFSKNTVGVQISGGNAITIIGSTWDTCGTSVSVTGINAFIALIDGTIKNSGVTMDISGEWIIASSEQSSLIGVPGNTDSLNFMIENLNKDSSSTSDIVRINGQTVMASAAHVDTYLYGNLAGSNYGNGKTTPHQTNQPPVKNSRPDALAPSGSYPIVAALSYSDKTVADVINVKDPSQNGNRQVASDNTGDQSQALNDILAMAAQQGKVVFFPSGVYRVQDTVKVPVGTEMVGEAWSTISGYGDSFNDESNPKAIVQIGQPNDKGVAHIQDMRFTVGQQLAGAIICQVNMAGNQPGDVAIHNSLITVGGTQDTEIDCSDEANCKAAYYGLHLAATSSAYIDNFWSWVADHASDNQGKGTAAAGKFGIIVESTVATWLMGIGSEHWWNSQLFFNGAENVLTSFFQSETNYRQNNGASVSPPNPFNVVSSDPNFSWCNGDAPCLMGANGK